MNYLTIETIVRYKRDAGEFPRLVTIASLHGDFMEHIKVSSQFYRFVKDLYVEDFLYHEENRELVVYLK